MLPDYFLRELRAMRIAPESNASAFTPGAGLISGTGVNAKAAVDKPAKSSVKPTDFITDLPGRRDLLAGAMWTHPPVAAVCHAVRVHTMHCPENMRTSTSGFVLAVLKSGEVSNHL